MWAAEPSQATFAIAVNVLDSVWNAKRINLPVIGRVWALTALLLIKQVTARNRWAKIKASRAVGTGIADQRSAFIDEDHPEAKLDRAWRNHCVFENRTKASQSLNRPLNKCKMHLSLLEYVKTDSNRHRICGIGSATNSSNTLSSFTASPVVNCSEVLRWLYWQQGLNCFRWKNKFSMNPAQRILHVYVSVFERRWEVRGTEALHRPYKQCAFDFASSTVSGPCIFAETQHQQRWTEKGKYYILEMIEERLRMSNL